MRCIGLAGVPSWSVPGSRNETGRRALLPELLAIRWAGRRVFVLYDSDAAYKPQVRDEAHRLGCALQREGADVRVSFVPAR